MKTLQAYNGDKTLKSKFLKEIGKHEKADAIVQGTYGEQNGTWKGCAVACSLRSLAILDGEKLHEKYDDHAAYETKLGIPEWLARLEDRLFEGMPKADAKKWPAQFAKAINVGANLEPVRWKFSAYLMKENIDRVLSLDISEELKTQVVSAIRGVLTLNEDAIRTGTWDESAARSAASAASAAWSAASAAWSAEWSAESAASAAWSAARSAASAASAAWSAASAAWSAEWSAESAASAAWSAEWSAARSAESAESAASAAWSAEWSAASAASAAWSAASAAYLKHSKELLKLLKKTH